MRTVEEIFSKAIQLIDAQNEQTGSVHTTDTREYEVRCCENLNTLLNEAYPYSDTYSASEYADDEDYVKGESVTYAGERYVCIQDCPASLDILPGSDAAAEYWRYAGKAGKRPVHPPVTDLSDLVMMDDFICMSALPAGLAALFVFDEDTNKYNAFWGDYMNRLAQAKSTLPASSGFEDIENPYAWGRHSAGIEYGEFAHW